MKTLMSAVAVAVILGLSASTAFAIHCPLLVKECEALVAKVEKSEGADKAMAADAKKGCAEAKKLHDGGKHKDAVIKAGEAISMAGKAQK